MSSRSQTHGEVDTIDNGVLLAILIEIRQLGTSCGILIYHVQNLTRWFVAKMGCVPLSLAKLEPGLLIMITPVALSCLPVVDVFAGCYVSHTMLI
jgi:hypothetical protein